ncbi:UvrD-helicase domain-containing protein [Actinomyces slackii]|uniref:DNA 3'-5' helicase n=1 Tax=Actinomyces slackii TaxID=52774 RepID=A0A3S4SMY3_9ACTO|nr:UvrD-helicase domain-containing protein [Actinomyces slackii]VEG73723.1 Helicase IV [Actinomyces slackii]
MPTIVWPSSRPKDAISRDPSLRAKIGPFITKLSGGATSVGLHVEPIRGSVDRRVRTARVTDFYRAVLFELDGGGQRVYVVYGIWPHDEAIAVARTVTVGINPYNGAAQVTDVRDGVGQDGQAVEEARRDARQRLADARREAEEIAREAARIEADNAEARRRMEEAGAPAPAGRVAGAEATPGVVVATRDNPPAWPDGLTVESLRDELGIDVRLAAAALAATRESELLDLAATAEPSWQGEALLALATGSDIEDVRENFELRHPRDVTTEQPTDEEVIAGLRTRAARSAFTWLETDEDLRRAIEGLTFAQWQLFLHPQQRFLVERRWNGPMRISGGAGTGKTVVTVHRAADLARRHAEAAESQLHGLGSESAPRILLTTFTRNLADDLRRQVAQLAPGVTFAEKVGEPGLLVSGLDKVARAILQRAGEDIAPVAERVLGRRRTRVLTYARNDLWQDVLALAGDKLPPDLQSADFLASEYELVVLPQHVTTLQQYVRVRRPGRGVSLDRRKRAAVWSAMERYRDRCTELDATSFAEQLALAAAWLDDEAGRGSARPYQHVLVDEAQDLTPSHLLLLRALVEPGPDDLFLAEDSHQRIYGKKIVLNHYGINIRGRSRRLTRNYRTTRQNLALAFGILDQGVYEDMEGQAEEHRYLSPRSGPEPVLLHADSKAEELDAAAQLLRRWLEDDFEHQGAEPGAAGAESLAILVRDRYQRDAVVTGLAERGIEVRPVDREAVGRGRPVVMTMHRAKGLEFRKVLLFDVSKASIPRALRDQQYSDADRADALLRERSLLYVAATRARDHLAVSWTGEPSPLLEGIVDLG